MLFTLVQGIDWRDLPREHFLLSFLSCIFVSFCKINSAKIYFLLIYGIINLFIIFILVRKFGEFATFMKINVPYFIYMLM